MNPKILIVDTYYPDFLKSWKFNPAASYESELQNLLNFSFGTFDAYSRNLRTLGWDADDAILNWQPAADFTKYDVVFMQDLSWNLRQKPKLLAGQCSCPWPGDERVKRFDVIFTSFPHYVPRIEALGVKAVYSPLGFDPIVLDRVRPISTERIHDVVFIGGVGIPSHWKRGLETLNAVAEAIPTFTWWGYGADLLPDGPLKQKHQGEAWGLDMYRILLQSKIVLNRHGEVAEGYANNMRMFEATGCGALLMTEDAPNLHQFFEDWEVQTYTSPEHAVDEIKLLLKNDERRAQIATKGHIRTMRGHTYARRMRTVSDTLKAML